MKYFGILLLILPSVSTAITLQKVVFKPVPVKVSMESKIVPIKPAEPTCRKELYALALCKGVK